MPSSRDVGHGFASACHARRTPGGPALGAIPKPRRRCGGPARPGAGRGPVAVGRGPEWSGRLIAHGPSLGRRTAGAQPRRQLRGGEPGLARTWDSAQPGRKLYATHIQFRHGDSPGGSRAQRRRATTPAATRRSAGVSTRRHRAVRAAELAGKLVPSSRIAGESDPARKRLRSWNPATSSPPARVTGMGGLTRGTRPPDGQEIVGGLQTFSGACMPGRAPAGTVSPLDAPTPHGTALRVAATGRAVIE